MVHHVASWCGMTGTLCYEVDSVFFLALAVWTCAFVYEVKTFPLVVKATEAKSHSDKVYVPLTC